MHPCLTLAPDQRAPLAAAGAGSPGPRLAIGTLKPAVPLALSVPARRPVVNARSTNPISSGRTVPAVRAKAVRQPTGVVVGIAPWNAPVILGVRAVAAPLAYGNTVVLKASEQCPRTHAAVVGTLTDAGVPAGAINLVTNDPEDAAEVVDELVAHPAVRRISFTGSTRVGRIIAEKAARHLKRVLLELGGNAPLVVLADAHLERAVAAASFGSFMHQGQTCMSTERIVIDRSVADEFAQMLGERARSLKVGDPREPDTQLGSPRQRRRAQARDRARRGRRL